jgi:anthranilate phosphoribosyltransferase
MTTPPGSGTNADATASGVLGARFDETDIRVPRRSTYAGFRATIKLIGTGERGRRSLSFDEAHDATEAIMGGEATPAQIGAFLQAMRIKGEDTTELAGMVQVLRDRATPLQARTDRTLVACAGAYDGCVEAPALSLAAGIIAAAAGAGIVVHCGAPLGPKHGVTAAQVLAELGGPAEPTAAQAEAMLERAGITLVNAATLLRGWADITVIRDEVGLRGPLHSAEKLVDWFGARRFLVGYTHAAYADRLCGALDVLGAERAFAVRGIEGSDIMRPGRPVVYERGVRVTLPEQLGDRIADAPGAEAAAQLTRAALQGRADRVVTYTVVLNAGLRLYAAGLAPTVLRGMSRARAAVADGSATATLEAMVA